MRLHEGTAKPINNEEFQRVIDNCHAESFDSLRDIAILQMSYRAGLRAMEIAALKLSDILDSKGEIRRTITLRKAGTKGNKEYFLYAKK